MNTRIRSPLRHGRLNSHFCVALKSEFEVSGAPEIARMATRRDQVANLLLLSQSRVSSISGLCYLLMSRLLGAPFASIRHMCSESIFELVMGSLEQNFEINCNDDFERWQSFRLWWDIQCIDRLVLSSVRKYTGHTGSWIKSKQYSNREKTIHIFLNPTFHPTQTRRPTPKPQCPCNTSQRCSSKYRSGQKVYGSSCSFGSK